MSDANVMTAPRITKVTINIGVGEGGNRLQTAEKVLELVTGSSPIRTISKKTNRELGTREGAPIGCKVTMRDKDAIASFLKDAFWVRENTLPTWNFDNQGNLSFGVADYTDFPNKVRSRYRNIRHGHQCSPRTSWSSCKSSQKTCTSCGNQSSSY